MNMPWPKLIKRSRSCKGRPKTYIPKGEFKKALANPKASGTDWLEFEGDVIYSRELAEKSVDALMDLYPKTEGLIVYHIARPDPGHGPNPYCHLNLDFYILSGVDDVYDSWKVPETFLDPGHEVDLSRLL